jgi:hypothetical protein
MEERKSGHDMRSSNHSLTSMFLAEKPKLSDCIDSQRFSFKHLQLTVFLESFVRRGLVYGYRSIELRQ